MVTVVAPDLVERAGGLGRAAAMREVVGPVLTSFLQPVYTAEISSAEVQALPAIAQISDVEEFSLRLYKDVLMPRFYEVIKENQDVYSALGTLDRQRRDLFTDDLSGVVGDVEDVLRDGIGTNIDAPLRLAAWIYRLEASKEDLILDRDRTRISAESLAGIMGRPGFDEILLRLTKGPNGFLVGSQDDDPLGPIMHDQFFSFEKPGSEPLTFKDAFELKDNDVIRLSDDYHIAALKKRKEIVEEFQENWEERQRYNAEHQYAESSGCPVRHTFETETGERQEPLVITAKQFLVSALRSIAQRQ